jgi:hypothetical protein
MGEPEDKYPGGGEKAKPQWEACRWRGFGVKGSGKHVYYLSNYF